MELKQREMGNLEDFNQLMVGPIEVIPEPQWSYNNMW